MFVKQKHVISRHRGKPEKEDTYTRKKKLPMTHGITKITVATTAVMATLAAPAVAMADETTTTGDQTNQAITQAQDSIQQAQQSTTEANQAIAQASPTGVTEAQAKADAAAAALDTAKQNLDDAAAQQHVGHSPYQLRPLVLLCLTHKNTLLTTALYSLCEEGVGHAFIYFVVSVV